MLELAPEWEEEAIRGLLGIKGRLLHAAAGAAEEDWIYTELDLAAIAPPLTRIANRYEPVRRYAGYGDPITVFIGMAGYATRSLIERRQALMEEAPPETETVIPPLEAEAPVPPSSAPAPPPPPRQSAGPAPSGVAPPAQPGPAPAPRRPARPAEAPVDPAQVQWERQGG